MSDAAQRKASDIRAEITYRMDNICHTLAGAALAEAGLKTRTRFGSATLMIAANLPDIDVLVFVSDIPSVALRRGWTHGVLAQLALPLLLTAAVAAFARWRPASAADPPCRIGWLLLLALLGVYSHVALDYLNNYGVRLLAPADWRWFYGDTLFIIDIWLWAALGAGVWFARARRQTGPARGALLLAAAYVGMMLTSAGLLRGTVETAWRNTMGHAPRALMVGPVPITPFHREVIVDAGDHYETGSVSTWTQSVTFNPTRVPKQDAAPAVSAARADPEIRAFLVWSRFPFWELEPVPDGTRVTVRDMRFAGRGGQFAISTIVPHGARTP